MVTSHIGIILYVTGAITASMILQFLSPDLVVGKILKLKVEGPTADLFERHWGICIFATGLLLMYAGYDPAVRVPAVLCAGFEKAMFVVLVLANSGKGYIRNFALIIAFDTLCVVLFSIYLAGVFPG